MAGTMQGVKPMVSGSKYFETQIRYYEEQFIQEVRQNHPEYSNLTNDELLKNKEVIEKLKDNPYAPQWKGSLADHFNVQGQIVEIDSWRKVCAGYAPNANLLDNPEKLNSNAFKVDVSIDANGNPEGKLVEKEGYRVGTEIIFGNSKEYSVLCAMTEGEQHKQLMDLKNKVLEQVTKAMEQDIYVRKTNGGVKTKERGKGLMYVSYHHIENRGATENHTSEETTKHQFEAEPFDHTHLFIANTTKDKDGNLCALDNDLIVKNKPEYNKMYSMLMSEGLRKLGYELEAKYCKDQVDNEYMEDTEKGVMTLVPVIPKELVEHFSKRSKQIQSEGDSTRSREIAQLENKNKKTEETNSELRTRWQGEAQNIDPKYTTDFFKTLQKTAIQENKLEQLTNQPEWDTKLVDSFYDHHKEIACNEAQIKSFLALKIHQYTTIENAERMAEEIFSRHFVAVLDKKDDLDLSLLANKPESLSILQAENLQIELNLRLQYIDKKRITQEKGMVESFYQRQHEVKFMLNKEQVEKLIANIEKEQGYKMNDQQREAVINQTTKKGAYALLSGHAGSGKSTSSKATVRAYQEAGFKVIGIGTSNKNTKGLMNETGLTEGYNTEKFLKMILNDKIKLDEKTILVCDEMAMADGYTWTRLVNEINKAGAGAKFLGESEQLKAVGASGGFELFRSLDLNNSKLTIINRQTLDWQKDAVKQFFNGQGDVALKRYCDEGKISYDNKTLNEANKIAVAEYFKVPEFKTDKEGNLKLDKQGNPVLKSKIIITDTNENASAINDQIRIQLQKEGKLGEDQATITTKRLGARPMAEGDKVVFKENLKFLNDGSIKAKASKQKPAFNVDNGDEATVKQIDTKNKTMTVEMADGSWRTIKTDQKFDVTHAGCITVHSSQGASIDNVFFVPTNASDLSKMYVACSRQKDDMLIVMNDELKTEIQKKTAQAEPTEKMLEIVQSIAEKNKLTIDPNMLTSFVETREFLNEWAYKLEGKEYKPHAMNDYASFMESSTKEQIKKTTFDYQTVDQSVLKFARAMKNKESQLEQATVQIETTEQIKARLEEQIQAQVAINDGGVKHINDVHRQPKSMSVQAQPQPQQPQVNAEAIRQQQEQIARVKQHGLTM